MNILVTGGSGFIGSNLLKKLRSEFPSWSIYSPTHHELNLINKESVSSFFYSHQFFDVVLHCAISGGKRIKRDDPQIIYDNVISTENLISNRYNFNKFINFSSGAEQFNTAYGLSKRIISEKVLKLENGLNIKIYGCFGETEEDFRFIKSNMKNALLDKPIIVHQNRFMSYIYIDDLYQIVKHYILHDIDNAEVIATFDPPMELIDIAKDIATICNYEGIITVETDGYNVSYYGFHPTSQFENVVGYKEGLKNVYNYMKKELGIKS